ncbi:nuclear transport factor 2 family protein [uncultured Erythrobacter sp.]|uniref:nuclear transport factor 2 family protein n=1 Tax=uncultured Erythrobacter sp. TaxID=263913 RepID=UPI00260B2D1F|nr:nuclear transport factor 2 family protein [uncultured Erythrobacter sp.]
MFRAVLAGLLALTSLPALAHGEEAAPDPQRAIVSAYVDAYNQRNLDAMLALMHDDVQWLSVEADTVTVFADGKADLATQMRDYMTSPMVTTSEVSAGFVDGNFVAVTEIARWTNGEGEEREQSALAVYEIEDGLVRRVWYYPATR